MNNKQREIIKDLYERILANGAAGDIPSCYNDADKSINELGETDSKLQEMLVDVAKSFENT